MLSSELSSGLSSGICCQFMSSGVVIWGIIWHCHLELSSDGSSGLVILVVMESSSGLSSELSSGIFTWCVIWFVIESTSGVVICCCHVMLSGVVTSTELSCGIVIWCCHFGCHLGGHLGCRLELSLFYLFIKNFI
jgi:hypothetical protein